MMFDALQTQDIVWIGLGLVGQALFSARFLVQWIASERRRQSHIPVAFWYLSIAGGVTLLTYAIYRADPVFILGQSTGVFIYARNLYLIRAGRAESSPAGT
ncbi:Lipid A biosynthesis protein [Salinisphaera orenii MK-B5]|uniref:Lipid A biosynthesis protein n=2 Tax=Salinisphaera TaxID=180541 RepID=A0A423PGF2_9GAMM|nr:Lipid A biosynthesis protein [Salinisphaera orenii MK-B5]